MKFTLLKNKDNLVVLLRQVSREDLPSVLSQEFLEDSCEGDHWFSSAQLGALHHALLVIDEEVSTAGQYCSTLLRSRLGWALCTEVCHKPVNQFAQVPADARKCESQTHTGSRARTRIHANSWIRGE